MVLKDRRKELAVQAFYYGYDRSKGTVPHTRIGDALNHVIWILSGGKIDSVSNATAKAVKTELDEFRFPPDPYTKPKKKKRRVRL